MIRIVNGIGQPISPPLHSHQADLWLKWSYRKMILSGELPTMTGDFWRLSQAWKRFKKAVVRQFEQIAGK